MAVFNAVIKSGPVDLFTGPLRGRGGWYPALSLRGEAERSIRSSSTYPTVVSMAQYGAEFQVWRFR